MKGEKAAYTLVDFVFTRNLMTKYSWSGNTKKGHIQKKCFKQFEHVFNFFYNLIKKADPTYTTVEMKNFFQNKVLTHALRRSSSTKTRSSQPKTRANKRVKVVHLNSKSEPIAVKNESLSDFLSNFDALTESEEEENQSEQNEDEGNDEDNQSVRFMK